MSPSKLVFLPGATGNAQFWQPVSNLLSHPAARCLLSWPGFGSTPPDPNVSGVNALVEMVIEVIDQPTALVAQSMGGVVAIQVALARPDLVTHLVLTATSGGVDVAGRGGIDWRPAMLADYPDVPRWFIDFKEDLTQALRTIAIPTLLLWGDADPISPVCVGQHLAQLLPFASLTVIDGGQHDLAYAHAEQVAALIAQHIEGVRA